MADTPHTFIVSDESIVNSYGLRVMTAGIDISQYKRNPVVLWYHKRPKTWDGKNGNEALPIGKGVKLWKEDGKLYVDVEFDSEDEFAKQIEGKVERGFIRMCSPALDPVTISDDVKYLLPGQTRATLVKSRLEEISVVDIGSNDNALRLSFDPEKNIDDIIPLVNAQKNHNPKKMEFQNQVAQALGLDPNTAPESVISTLKENVKLAKQAEDYKTKHEALQTQVDEMSQGKIIELVNASQDKKFTADKRETFIKLGKDSGYDTLKGVIDAMPDMVKPGELINHGSQESGKTDGDEVLTFAKLKEKGMEELEKFKAEKPAEYIKLYKAEHGVEPEMK